MEKTTKKKVKKAILGVTSVALVAGVTSALTMAMLSDMQSAENTFTANPQLSLELYEPKWGKTTSTGNTQSDNYKNALTGKNYNSEEGDYGADEAKSYIPGDPINKNPFVVNTSDSDEYVAIRLTYQVKCNNNAEKTPLKPGTYNCPSTGDWHTIKPDTFKTYFATTDYNGSTYNEADFDLDETNKDKCEYYYYMKNGKFVALTKYVEGAYAEQTSELFKKVIPNKEYLEACDDEATNDHHMFKVEGCEGCDPGNKYIVNNTGKLEDINGNQVVLLVGNQEGLPNFRIIVEAAAVQTRNMDDVETTKATLRSCFPAMQAGPES